MIFNGYYIWGVTHTEQCFYDVAYRFMRCSECAEMYSLEHAAVGILDADCSINGRWSAP